MNKAKLKSYAPQARRDFIQAMTDRAAYFGLTPKKIEPVVEKGDVAVIGGRSFPIAVAKRRKALEDRIKRHGFEQTMEAMAYTWFNRLVAIRFMELHGYLDHGYRVLSARNQTTDNTDGTDGKSSAAVSSSVSSVKSVVQTPEFLVHAEHVELPGLKKEAVIDLKLAGNKEGELYRLLLTAQCNALHTAMPFLFERIADETELLLPDNLLNSDSLMRKLVGEIEEEDWNEVEIIGWLYQFYISERKDEVIGKVVASEDIPAATQLFTPNWIVKYLVQNTLGRQWLATYPQSALRQQMEYYIEPAEQSPEVQEQLKAITPTSLNPEELTLLDPACGSGHILVEAYDLFKAIYQERGYRAKDIPALILQKNLFGLEIDDRAAQLAAFALMMKARADDRRIFDSEAKPNILAFEDSQGMKASEIHFALTSPLKGEEEGELESAAPDGHLFEPDDNLFTRAEAAKAAASRTPTTVNFSQADIEALLELFENAKTFGSLIQVSPKLASKLPKIEKRLDDVLTHGDLTHASAHVLKPLLQQAQLLARQYDAVVANPPYMGYRLLTDKLKTFARDTYPQAKADIFACFIVKCVALAKPKGSTAMVTMEAWLTQGSYIDMRNELLHSCTIYSVCHIGYNSFPSLNSKVVRAAAFSILPYRLPQHVGVYHNLNSVPHFTDKNQLFCERRSEFEHHVRQEKFIKLPDGVIAFAINDALIDMFEKYPPLSKLGDARQGLSTSDTDRFLKMWFEVSFGDIEFNADSSLASANSRRRWYPHCKGGGVRRWYGNHEWVIDWRNNGESLKGFPAAVLRNQAYYFRSGITWCDLTSSAFTARVLPAGFVFDTAGPAVFASKGTLPSGLLAYLNSTVFQALTAALVQGLHYTNGVIATIPVPQEHFTDEISKIEQQLVTISADDYARHETAWEFRGNPLVLKSHGHTLRESWGVFSDATANDIAQLQQLEGRVNQHFVSSVDVPSVATVANANTITLYQSEQSTDIKRLLSYAIGCMMGRYSLDHPGLIYAQGGNHEFDASRYQSFRADDDGIIPLLETDWGIRDDATNRFVEFISVAWPKEHLEENLKFVAESLGSNNGEQARETIRRYLATGFYKHHLSMYKKRPIYWLFSSGKQRAFQCLVYLHRYHEGTLARMRTEYVIPLQGQIAARIEQLEGDKAKATSTSHRNKIQKEQDKLKKQETELRTFEEKLKHAADQKISLDLDDGVKVNYAKFGDLLAESKAICGTKDED